MSKIDLEADNVTVIEATVQQVRDYDFTHDPDAPTSGEGNSFSETLEMKLDEAQGAVFTGDESVAYVVIEIRK
jgi:hypothetical protein